MQKESPQTSTKIRFKLIQPAIKCSGRDDVTCYYRGKIISEDSEKIICKIKVYNQDKIITFNKVKNEVEEIDFKDLKIV